MSSSAKIRRLERIFYRNDKYAMFDLAYVLNIGDDKVK